MAAKIELPLSILDEYADGKSLTILGKEYGCQARTIQRHITDHGGIIRKRGQGQQMYRKLKK